MFLDNIMDICVNTCFFLSLEYYALCPPLPDSIDSQIIPLLSLLLAGTYELTEVESVASIPVQPVNLTTDTS
jgi:hypothetical protein